MIVSRVVVGDPWYADKVDKTLRLPPVRTGTKRNYDSVIAKPGPMPHHANSSQTHQEFVIFDNAQAYPAFIVQYIVE